MTLKVKRWLNIKAYNNSCETKIVFSLSSDFLFKLDKRIGNVRGCLVIFQTLAFQSLERLRPSFTTNNESSYETMYIKDTADCFNNIQDLVEIPLRD